MAEETSLLEASYASRRGPRALILGFSRLRISDNQHVLINP